MRPRWIALIVFAALSACMPKEIPKETLQFAAESPARRRLESRSFAGADETKLLSAGAAVLKEIGFTVDNKVDELGFVAASKQGSAYNVGEIAASAATAVISQATGIGASLPFSKNQSLRAALIARPGESEGAVVVRVTLQRVVWDTEGKVSKSELLSDPSVYADFFAKLSKAAGLEAHEL
jgi:hypothetical protein